MFGYTYDPPSFTLGYGVKYTVATFVNEDNNTTTTTNSQFISPLSRATHLLSYLDSYKKSQTA